MRVQFEQAGGFAPSAMRRSHAVNSDELSSEDANELKRLVADALSTGPVRQDHTSVPRPDAFYYRVIIEDGGTSHTIKASDSDMPASLRPLITWLTQRSSST